MITYIRAISSRREFVVSSTNLRERMNAVPSCAGGRDPLCTKLKTRLQFLGTVPLLTGADRMQDRPWTPCSPISRLSFSPPLSVALSLSLRLSFPSLSLQFDSPPFVLTLLPPFAAPLYVMAPGRRHSGRYFLASLCERARSR